MAGIPIYISSGEPASPGIRPITPQPLPDLPDGAAIEAGTERLGRALGQVGAATDRLGEAQTAEGNAEQSAGGVAFAFANALQNARDQSIIANAHTEYLTKLSDAQSKWESSPDYLTAPGNFATDRAQFEQDALAKVDDAAARSKLQLQLRRVGLTAQSSVDKAALTSMTDAQRANLDSFTDDYVTRAANAPSPTEKQAFLQNLNEEIDRNAASGFITRINAVQRKLNAASTIDIVAARGLIDKDPQAAAAALANPDNFPGIGPMQRLQLTEQARSAVDTRRTNEIGQAAMFNPAGAIATVGVVSNPSQMSLVYDRGILAIETNGNPGAVSDKGAAGPGQVMPATARELLKGRGRDDLAALDDTALTAKLTENNGALSRDLGREYWLRLGQRYQGDVPVMAAAYNAGPANADRWLSAATQKFGPHFDAKQFASVIDYGETRDYVGKLYQTLGAPMDGGGLSVNARFSAAATVGNVIAQQDAQRQRMYSAEAKNTQDDFGEMFRAGKTPDPVAYGIAVQKNQLAAAGGNAEAATWLANTKFQESVAPLRDAAYRLAPAVLADHVAAIEADQRNKPVTQAQVDQLGVLKETLKDVTKRASDDPIGLAERAKIITQPVPIDTAAKPEDPQFAAALSARGAQAQAAQAFYRGDYKVLKPEEEKALRARYNQAGAEERFGILKTAAAALDDRGFTAFVSQATGKSEAVAAGLLSRDRPALAREILGGMDLLKSKEVAEKAALVKPAFADKLGGLLYVSPEMQRSVETMATALYASRSGNNGTLYDPADTSGVEKAIDDVAGKIVKRNGARVPAPPGMTAAQFGSALDNLSDRDLAQFGGAYDRNGRSFSASTIADRAVLKPLAVGGSKYVVGIPDASARDGFAPVWTGSEIPQPLVIDVRQLGRGAPPPPLTPYQRGASAFRAGQVDRINAARDQSEGP